MKEAGRKKEEQAKAKEEQSDADDAISRFLFPFWIFCVHVTAGVTKMAGGEDTSSKSQ